ncbi:hypothetical protein ANN_23385 [Periplaneta americana]|uniref:Uncharacterized protein n=1 Tax=Periplaneta americana TaxID=6978 RepID=A0ABQ8SKY4_PERAM|nr:hypothetical protein ANN_23385 [Periplaneta americana]
MSPGSSTESYPAFARIGLREIPGKNLNQERTQLSDLFGRDSAVKCTVMAVDIGHIRQHICLTWSQATKGNIEGGSFDPALWIEFGVAQWSERLQAQQNKTSVQANGNSGHKMGAIPKRVKELRSKSRLTRSRVTQVGDSSGSSDEGSGENKVVMTVVMKLKAVGGGNNGNDDRGEGVNKGNDSVGDGNDDNEVGSSRRCGRSKYERPKLGLVFRGQDPDESTTHRVTFVNPTKTVGYPASAPDWARSHPQASSIR